MAEAIDDIEEPQICGPRIIKPDAPGLHQKACFGMNFEMNGGYLPERLADQPVARRCGTDLSRNCA